MNNSKFMFVLPDDMRKELQEIASKYSISLSAVIEFLEKSKKEN